jgi:hypothetical protein
MNNILTLNKGIYSESFLNMIKRQLTELRPVYTNGFKSAKNELNKANQIIILNFYLN